MRARQYQTLMLYRNVERRRGLAYTGEEAGIRPERHRAPRISGRPAERSLRSDGKVRLQPPSPSPRLYFLQQWFNLSDPAVEEALYDSAAMRRFVGIDLGREPVPDETTVCRFRHLLEEHDLGRPLFDEVQRHLAVKGMKVATGTIVDAVLAKAGIINAPSSTKNADKARDPEMHQTRKGNQWYFGMKAHFGVDSRSKLDPRGGGDAGQCRRQHGTARAVARARDPGVG